MIFLRALWGRIWPYIAAVGAVLAGLAAVRQGGKQAGREEIEQKRNADALDAIRRSNANREEVSQMDDDDQLAEFDRLRAARRTKKRR